MLLGTAHEPLFDCHEVLALAEQLRGLLFSKCTTVKTSQTPSKAHLKRDPELAPLITLPITARLNICIFYRLKGKSEETQKI